MAKVGRPTDYEPKFCRKVDVYIGENQDIWTEFHKTRGIKSDSYDRVVEVKLPSRDGFAKYLGVVRQTLDNWSKEHEEFLDALERIDTEQKLRLQNEGLSGNYNPTISKLLLSANHGVIEKSETDVTSKGEKIQGFAVELIHGETKNPDTSDL